MSKIEWTEQTWNPIGGCTKVSPGCANCYAVSFAHRHANNPTVGDKYKGLTVKHSNGKVDWSGKIHLYPERLEIPLRRKKPTMYFVNSMSDLFHEDVPFEFIDKVFAVMAICIEHTFQVLTKRPKRMAEYFSQSGLNERLEEVADVLLVKTGGLHDALNNVPLPNVWLGVSVENQAAADERIPLLLQTPAAIRFLSCEPLLGPVDLRPSWMNPTRQNDNPVSWVICGGESSPNARPMHPDWARGLRDQCKAANIPFYFKQWGEWGVNEIKACAFLSKNRSSQLNVVVSETKSEKPIAYYAYPSKGNDEIGAIETMSRLGKHRAGRTLDGQTHDEYPK